MKILWVEVKWLKEQLQPKELTAQEMAEMAEYNPNIEALIKSVKESQDKNVSWWQNSGFIW